LAPDIVTAIVNGKNPPHLTAKKLMRLALKLPTDWEAAWISPPLSGGTPQRLLLSCDHFGITAALNVDPQMPPERLSRRCAREFDEKSSLPLQMESAGPKCGGISRGIRRSRNGKKLVLYQ